MEHGTPQTKQKKQSTVEIFGGLSLGFGVLGLFGTLYNLAFVYFGHTWKFFRPEENPVMRIMLESRDFLGFLRGIAPIGLLFSVLLLVAGIGLLKRRLWARKVAMVYAVAGFILNAITLYMNWVYLYQPLFDQMNTFPRAQRIGAMAGGFSGVIGQVIGFVFPVVLFYFMRKPSFLRELEAGASATQPSSHIPPPHSKS